MIRHFFILLSVFLSAQSVAQWLKISDADYVWGPFKIYNIALFSEDGRYVEGSRPLMLTLKYAKPVEGRDFAISLARSWSNLGITLPEQDSVVERLRKIMPNIRTDDRLSYIALEDRGYFILNDQVIPEEFNQDFNNAVVSVWLDPRVEIGRTLLKDVPKTLVSAPVETKENAIVPESLVLETNVVSSEMIHHSLIENNQDTKGSEQHSDTKYPNPEIEILPPFDAPLNINDK
ncbi:pyruvate formate lyase-activating protein [Bibersteinia trehalosi]|uniref:pyruvate formate lyase-activating protein n=1 Tax=Bibersteinia trehalosi TaxID=47735 RepID=UPI003D26C5D4